MSDKELDNKIFLMFLITERYTKAHSLTYEQFLELKEKLKFFSI